MMARPQFVILLVIAPSLLAAATALRAQQAPAGPPSAPTTTVTTQAPDWVPLPKDHADYIDKILNYWEYTSKGIQRYQCRFRRWEYDANAVGNAEVAKTYAEGVIKYAAPDKGLFHVEKSLQVVLPLTAGQEAKYKANEETLNEHWVCDGKSIFEFDGLNKQLKQRELPPEMQGKQIVEGPLPFLFGAKADAIKARYWIRAKVPPPKSGVFWLEAYPKTREDAANFRSVQVVINESDWLPEGMVLLHRNKATTTFGFEQREKNWTEIVGKLNPFHSQFFEPKTPPGWKKVVEKFQEPGEVPVSVPAPPLMQTQRPTTRATR
jgi:TIGR03009 family protein